MKFSLSIYASPLNPEPARSALRFAQALVDAGHSIYRLFFFNEGVLNGIAMDQGPSTADSIRSEWQALIAAQGLDAVVCVSSAQKRGIAADASAPGLQLAKGFTIGGLGQLIDAAVNSDRVITFGS